MTVLVLGSTGSTGRRVTRQLRERDVPARAASRHGEVPFDWSVPATWGPALADVSAIYVMAPDGVPVEEAFVQQAVAAATGRPVDYKGSPQDFTAANPDAPEEALTAFTRQLVLGDATPTTTVEDVTGRPPISFRTYADAAAASGAWT